MAARGAESERKRSGMNQLARPATAGPPPDYPARRLSKRAGAAAVSSPWPSKPLPRPIVSGKPGNVHHMQRLAASSRPKGFFCKELLLPTSSPSARPPRSGGGGVGEEAQASVPVRVASSWARSAWPMTARCGSWRPLAAFRCADQGKPNRTVGLTQGKGGRSEPGWQRRHRPLGAPQGHTLRPRSFEANGKLSFAGTG